ncbi:MAG: hypothetical protein GXO87_13340 [Chlorobi bacterium]|nr:hypothetical protein [Chlorobiota bacterium]
MGTQQLLFIVLGAIVITLSVVIGMNYFAENAKGANRDAVILDLNRLATTAQAYYKKGKEAAGGEKSFRGFQIPEKLKKTQNGSYRILYKRPNRILIQGVGVEDGQSWFNCSGIKVKITEQVLVRPDDITLRKIF